MTAEQLASRNEAIKRAWDDPLRRAIARARASKIISRNASRDAYNAYHRAYRQRCRPRADRVLYA